MREKFTVLICFSAILLASGCGSPRECNGICESAIVLSIKGALGSGAPDVSITGAEGNCAPDATQGDLSVCYLASKPGTYVVNVAAPGYKQQNLDVSVEATKSNEPCDCGYKTSRVELALEPV